MFVMLQEMFVIFRFSLRKKKLNSYITFPEVLDMSEYLHSTSGPVRSLDAYFVKPSLIVVVANSKNAL